MVFAYLPGATLFHRIALLNKKVREELPKAAMLDQIITIPISKDKSASSENIFPKDSFIYAVRLCDCF